MCVCAIQRAGGRAEIVHLRVYNTIQYKGLKEVGSTGGLRHACPILGSVYTLLCVHWGGVGPHLPPITLDPGLRYCSHFHLLVRH